MARLILVRHAQTPPVAERPASQWDLDPAGLAALEALAALPGFALAGRIVSSTEGKAVLTAEAIRRAHPHLRHPHAGCGHGGRCELARGPAVTQLTRVT